MSTMPPPPEPVAGGRLPLWLALDEVGDGGADKTSSSCLP